MNNYGRYGITIDMVEENIIPLIDDGIKDGLSYELIYLYLRSMLDKLTGQEFYCTRACLKIISFCSFYPN